MVMPASFLQRVEEKFGLPKLAEVTNLLTGEGGKRLDTILTKLERLSSNQGAIKDAIELLKVVEQLNQSGGLDKLDSVLSKLPRGKNQQAIIAELQKLLSGLDSKIDRISNLAKMILEREE